jgi:hypothetical protein
MVGDGVDETDVYHFVGEDAIETVMMQGDHPIEALHLVSPHLTVNDYQRKSQIRRKKIGRTQFTAGRLLEHERRLAPIPYQLAVLQ